MKKNTRIALYTSLFIIFCFSIFYIIDFKGFYIQEKNTKQQAFNEITTNQITLSELPEYQQVQIKEMLSKSIDIDIPCGYSLANRKFHY